MYTKKFFFDNLHLLQSHFNIYYIHLKILIFTGTKYATPFFLKNSVFVTGSVCKYTSGSSLTYMTDLLRFCLKGLLDIGGGNQLKNSPAPISHFECIFNVSPSSSGSHSNREKKYNFVPD